MDERRNSRRRATSDSQQGMRPSGRPSYNDKERGLQIRINEGEIKFNRNLFFSALAGGAVGLVLDIFLFSALYESIPGIVLFGIIMALFSLGMLGGASLSCTNYNKEFGKVLIIVLLSTVLMFGLGCLFEFIYEMDFTPKETVTTPVKEVSATDYIFCIDDSGSMYDYALYNYKGNDPTDQRYVAFDSILGKLNEENYVGLIRFDDTAYATVIPAPLNDKQIQKFDDARQVETPSGGTNFEEPLNRAYQMYEDLALTGRKQIVVLLSDGEADLDIDDMVDKYNQAGLIICTVYLGKEVDIPEILTELAQGTGGSAYHVQDADMLVQTFTTLVNKTQKMSNQTEDYKRFLWNGRSRFDKAGSLAIIERILFFTVFGLLYGIILYIMLGEALKKQIFVSLAGGLLCGLIMETAFGASVPDTAVRLSMLLMALVFANKFYKGGSQIYSNRVSEDEPTYRDFSGRNGVGNKLNDENDPGEAGMFGVGSQGGRPDRGQVPGSSDDSGFGAGRRRNNSGSAGNESGTSGLGNREDEDDRRKDSL